ncbi:MAG TPA: glycerate kinase [Gammaproteobacteria bacterium]|nr:glycerate kinase [Gammaproteobacteria bacterium]
MKIVIAPDSFKENLTSLQVASCIEKGIKRVLPKARCIKVPMADGGEGTVQSLVDATGGKIVSKQVTGPMDKPVKARYGMLGDGKTAVIEMAEASGLPLIPRARRNPMKATSYGTGELITHALDKGATTIIIGLGGSATVDGGAGLAQALGVNFLDKSGRKISQHGSGGMLEKIADIDISALDPRVKKAKFIIASDVTNTLCGSKGAAHVFGPQKGATPAMVKTLDRNLRQYAAVIKRCLRKNVLNVKGAGAAGGLGAGLIAFTGARMKRGVDLVVEITNLRRQLENADLVITGEGRVDFQTAFGKTPAGVAKAARKHKIPCIAIGGSLADDARGVFAHGIDGLASAAARDMSLDEAIRNSRKHLEYAGERVIRLLLIGKKMTTKRK